MTFDLQSILESKGCYRQRLAARPIAEKLLMLDAMRELALLLRPESSSVLREEPPAYGRNKSNPWPTPVNKNWATPLQHRELTARSDGCGRFPRLQRQG